MENPSGNTVGKKPYPFLVKLSANFNLIVKGFGFADVENQVGATPNTVMRIASISKSITMAALGRLMDEGSVELDKPVFEYVPEWPKVT